MNIVYLQQISPHNIWYFEVKIYVILIIYLKCQGFSLQHIQYIDSCTQLMNFIGFPPFYLLLHHADVGNEMGVHRVIKCLFPHLWRVLP